MQPHAVAPSDRGNRRQRIDRRRRRRAGGRHHGARHKARREVGLDGRGQRLRAHRVRLVVRDVADVGATEAGEQRGLVHRAVTVRGCVDHERRRLGLQTAA
jgi:hypothetical protein